MSQYDMISAKLKERYEKHLEKLQQYSPKILLVGASGTGKSSCVNVLFGLDLGDELAAEVRHGEPCTQNFTIYGPTARAPVRIIDSKGVEMMTVESQMDEITDYIVEQKSGRPEHHVHLAYYFAKLSRWEEADTELVKRLRGHLSVVIVINKCDIRTEEEIAGMKGVIERDLGDIRIAECGDPRGRNSWIPSCCAKGHTDILSSMRTKTWRCEAVVDIDEDGFEVLCDEKGDDSPFGYKELVRMSLANLPELVRPSFQSAQKVDLSEQHNLAAMTIMTSTGLAVTAGASPIPFSDLVPLFVIEAGMAGSLMAIYGVPVHNFSGQDLIALNAAVIGVGGIIGKALAAIVKSTVGYAAGAAVDMTVAGAAVLTIGIAIAAVLTRAILDGRIEKDENINFFHDVREIIASFDPKALYASVMGTSDAERQEAISDLIHSNAQPPPPPQRTRPTS